MVIISSFRSNALSVLHPSVAHWCSNVRYLLAPQQAKSPALLQALSGGGTGPISSIWAPAQALSYVFASRLDCPPVSGKKKVHPSVGVLAQEGVAFCGSRSAEDIPAQSCLSPEKFIEYDKVGYLHLLEIRVLFWISKLNFPSILRNVLTQLWVQQNDVIY